ncbi:MAG: hypothetical protein ACTSQI_16650 [Candidatus Helarchaeota archaeon]
MKKQKMYLLALLVFVIMVCSPPPNQAVIDWNEIAYDDESAETSLVLPANDSVAVKFTKPADNFQLTGINLYCNTSNFTKITVWVLNNNMDIIMAPLYPGPAAGVPPYEISFGDAGPIFTSSNATDFYIVVQWRTNDIPYLAISVDTNSSAGHSYTNQSGSWQAYSSGNIMIHARFDDIVGPSFDHIPLQYAVSGEDLSLSVEVSDEFGVESVTLAYRPFNSTVSFSYIAFTRASGTPLRGIWYGKIPGQNVTPAGLEYYLWATDVGLNQKYYGNASVPFTVAVVSVFRMSELTSILIIVGICAAAIVVYLILPEFKGEDTK